MTQSGRVDQVEMLNRDPVLARDYVNLSRQANHGSIRRQAC